MPKLYFTIGLPRSGKSTRVTKWAKESPMRAIVSSDNIRLALTGQRYQPLAETMVFATKHVMIRALLDRGFDVAVDGTHSTEISITRLYEIDINAEHWIVPTGKNECIERATLTGHTDLYSTIERISNNLDNLGFWNAVSDMNKLEYNYSCSFEENLKKIKKSVIDRGLYVNNY